MRHVPVLAFLTGTLCVSIAFPLAGQITPSEYRDEFLRHFEQSSRKVISLAEAVPQDLYAWSPGEGVMPVSQVFMHIARYNYMYLETSLGIPAPNDLDQDALESISDKTRVRTLLQRSVDHVREHVGAMTDEEVAGSTVLYGRNVAGWAVLFQLLAHMNEHVGQSVSYARMNGIVPPWSTD
jgi:uncharacterized damage-inducible protein DinB